MFVMSLFYFPFLVPIPVCFCLLPPQCSSPVCCLLFAILKECTSPLLGNIFSSHFLCLSVARPFFLHIALTFLSNGIFVAFFHVHGPLYSWIKRWFLSSEREGDAKASRQLGEKRGDTHHDQRRKDGTIRPINYFHLTPHPNLSLQSSCSSNSFQTHARTYIVHA